MGAIYDPKTFDLAMGSARLLGRVKMAMHEALERNWRLTLLRSSDYS
jgi:hypothetical protein